MQLFLKLLIGTLKVLLFMFLQRETERNNHQARKSYRRRGQRSESSTLSSELLIQALFSGGQQ
jgi:hypothetical protein